MFAAMYSNSNDLFFAPENPGIQLFNDSGVPYTGIIADAVKLWDNGTRVNEQPGPNVNHPGVAQAGVVTEVKGTDSEGHNYPAASSLLQVSLTFDAAQSLFTCTSPIFRPARRMKPRSRAAYSSYRTCSTATW